MRKSIRVDPKNKELNEFEQIVPKKENQVNPNCFVCNKELTQISHLMLPEEKLFVHIEHFNCEICKKNLADEGYFENKGKFFCQDDYYKNNPSICKKCNENIYEDFIVVDNLKYHKNCFTCDYCKKILKNKSYKKNKNSYCEDCIKIVLRICNKCNKLIEKDCFSSNKGSLFHKECFNCGKCSQNLANSKFINKDNTPYHVDCLKSLLLVKCECCGKDINENYLKVYEKNIHKGCLETFKSRIGLK